MPDFPQLQLPIQRLPHGETLPLRASKFAAGFDLHAAIDDDMVLPAGDYCLIPTGFAIALPQDCEAQIRPRSGLAFKYGVTILNSPGTIDADYRGEIKVLLINHGKQDFIIQPKMRIAQMVIARYVAIEFQLCEELPVTMRGVEGFGSTGT